MSASIDSYPGNGNDEKMPASAEQLNTLFEDMERLVFKPDAPWANERSQLFPDPLDETQRPGLVKDAPPEFSLPYIKGETIITEAEMAASDLGIKPADLVRVVYAQHGQQRSKYYPSQATIEVHRPTPKGRETHTVVSYEVAKDWQEGDTMGFADWEQRRDYETVRVPSGETAIDIGSAIIRNLNIGTPQGDVLPDMMEEISDKLASVDEDLYSGSSGATELELSTDHVAAMTEIVAKYPELLA